MTRIRRGKWAAAALCMAILLASCGQNQDKTELTYRDRDLLAQKLEPQVAAATNAFGLDLVQRLIEDKPGTNVIVSPVSVAQALAMTMNGASGTTRDAMAKVLRLNGMPLEKVNEAEGVMSQLLGKSSPGVSMSTANSLWLQKGWPFRSTFLDSVRQAYGAKLEQRELTDPKVRKEINSWVNRQTKGRIPTIVDEPVSELTKLMLVNALYLKAAWETPFEKSATQDGDFIRADGSVKRVPMMHRTGGFAYDEEEEYQAVRLPYGDGQLSMLVVLPKPGADRKALAAKLFSDPAWWEKSYKRYMGALALPRFRIDMTAKLEETLTAMGMNVAFSPKTADFSAMADSDAQHEPLYISRVLHKTYLDVSEKGTEAAAATIVEMKAGSAPPSGRFEMNVNRPFWLAIVDEQSHLLLFAGAVEQP